MAQIFLADEHGNSNKALPPELSHPRSACPWLRSNGTDSLEDHRLTTALVSGAQLTKRFSVWERRFRADRRTLPSAASTCWEGIADLADPAGGLLRRRYTGGTFAR